MLLTAACVAPVVAYDATTILPDRGIEILPGEIANDGKTYVYLSNVSGNTTHFYIYDEDFQLVKEFETIPDLTADYSYQVQERETIPVSATISNEYMQDSFISIDGVSEGLTIQMVLSKLGNGWEIVTLEDGTQVVAASTDFYEEVYFGKKYPRKYYKQVDGLWHLCSAYYNTQYAPYGEWKEPEKYEGTRSGRLCEIYLMPLDGADFLEYNLTRGIFSEDFNYMYPEYRKVEFNNEYIYNGTDHVYRKEWGYRAEIRAFKVYDSSNKEVATLEIPEGYQTDSYYPQFYRLGNKKHITVALFKEIDGKDEKERVTAVYLIDSNNRVSLMTITPSSTVSPRTPRQGETVTVTFDDSAISSERTVQVVSTSGHLMNQAKVHAGENSIDIDTSRLQQGMYIVNILTEGRAREAAKIIVR